MGIDHIGACRHLPRIIQAWRRVALSSGVALALASCGGGSIDELKMGAAPSAAVTNDAPAVAASVSEARALPPAAARAPMAASDALVNENFEAGMSAWSNWGNAVVVDGAGAGGSLRALRVGTGAGGAGETVFGIMGGATYRVTAQLRATDTSGPIYLGINFLDASANQIGTRVVQANSASYSLASFDAVAPAGSASAVLFVWKNAGSGYAFVDDVVLATASSGTPTPPPPPPTGNLLSNAGFESGMASWMDWGNSLVVAGAGTSSSHALRVGTAAGGAGQDVGGIVPGATYQLRASVRVSDASETGYAGVNILDASGTTVAQQIAVFNSTSLTGVNVVVTAPSNAVRAVVFVWKNAGGGFAYADDFSFAALDGSTPPPPPPDPSVNLLSNPGFESGMAAWTDWGNSLVVDGAGVSGSHALRVGTGAGGAGQQVAVVAGAQYRFTANVRVSSASEHAFIGVNMVDAAGNNVAQQSVPIGTTAFSGVSFSLSAPSTAVRSLVYVWKDAGSGYAFVDDVVLSRTDGGSPSPGDAVVNGGFENGLSGWTSYGYETAQLIGDAAVGSYAIRVESPWAGGAGVLQFVPVTPGQKLRLSAYAKTDSAGDAAYVGLKFTDSSQDTVCFPEGCPASQVLLTYKELGYQLQSGEVVVPAGMHWAIVWVAKGDSLGFGYFDQVSLVPVQ